MNIKTLSYFLLVSLFFIACKEEPKPHLEAYLYYRYDVKTNEFTAEAMFHNIDTAKKIDEVYTPQGGVAFLGSNVDIDIQNKKMIRHRVTRRENKFIQPTFRFKNLDGEPVTIGTELKPFDTLILDRNPTQNFGFTVFGPEGDQLLINDELSVIFDAENGQAYFATLAGPTLPDGAFKFERKSVGGWPLLRGDMIFIRRRTSDININGVKGKLVEEIYSQAIPTLLTNE